MNRRSWYRITMAIWLVVLWIALWGQITIANLVGGIAVMVAVTALLPLPGEPGSEERPTLRPLYAIRFLVYFAWLVAISNIQLAVQVISPRPHLRPGIVRLPLRHCSDAVVTVIANAITLTPGSITIEVRRSEPEPGVGDAETVTVIYVHIVRIDDLDAAREGLVKLAHSAIIAFGSARALTAIEELREHPELLGSSEVTS